MSLFMLFFRTLSSGLGEKFYEPEKHTKGNFKIHQDRAFALSNGEWKNLGI